MGVIAASGEPVGIGVSSCLLGAEVRHDGGHKRDPIITDVLGPYFKYIPVCPEFEAGMGVPREAVRLVGNVMRPRMRSVKSLIDYTRQMERFSKTRVKALTKLNLSGFLLKSKSPSCGVQRVKLYNPDGEIAGKKAQGIFARHVQEGMEHLPVEEERRLGDPSIRENFIARVFCYNRWRQLVGERLTPGRLVDFHTAHELLILSHSPERYRRLGRFLAAAKNQTPARLAASYANLFFEALRHLATPRRNTKVLQHVAGYLKKMLAKDAREELFEIIDDYSRGLAPLLVPVTLINHHARKHAVVYLSRQVYLNPHPTELLLRSHP